MKKITIFLLVIVLCLMIAGCTETKDETQAVSLPEITTKGREDTPTTQPESSSTEKRENNSETIAMNTDSVIPTETESLITEAPTTALDVEDTEEGLEVQDTVVIDVEGSISIDG